MSLLNPNIKKYVTKWKADGENGDLLDKGVFENEDGNVIGSVREENNSIRVFEPGDSLILRMPVNSSLHKDFDIEDFSSERKFIGKAKSKSKFLGFGRKTMWIENPKKEVVLSCYYPYSGENNKFVDSNGKTVGTLSKKELTTVLDIQDLNFDRKILLSFYVYVAMRGPTAFGQ